MLLGKSYYRVNQGKVSLFLTNIWISSDAFNFFYGFQHVPNMIAIDLWPLALVKSNISVLHSLSFEGWQNLTKFQESIQKKTFFQNIKIVLF